MSMILGIDTGGTTTNAVIYDKYTDEIIWKNRAFTTKGDLSLGIREAIEPLPLSIKPQLTAVHLSTTLATNYVLESDFDNIGLVLIGDATKISLPCKNIRRYNGDVPVNDRPFPSNLDSIIVAASDATDFAHEKKVCDILCSKGYPAKAATSICDNKDSRVRIPTAVFNTGLIPIMNELLASMENVLSDLDIGVPLYIMCGDGSLARPKDVLRFPLATLMSGPAASVAGGLFLCDEEDFLLVDVGGTSADITRIINRCPQRENTTVIRDTRIQVESLKIKSFPVGGDSQVYFSHLGQLAVGPERVIPLCLAGSRWPHLEEELRTYRRPKNYEMFTVNDTDCFCPCGSRSLSTLSPAERELVQEIRKQPHSLFYLSEKLGRDADSLHIDKLLNRGYLQKISFTPTDLLHVLGRYTEWNRSISRTAADILAELGGFNLQKLLSLAEKSITDQMAFYCMQSISDFENRKFDFRDSRATQYVIDHFLNKIDPYLLVIFKIAKPIVAVGAPARCWLPKVAAGLGAKIILPPHYESANAVGAAVAMYADRDVDVVAEEALEKLL